MCLANDGGAAGLFLLSLESGKLLHQTALAARSVIRMQNTLDRCLVQDANSFQNRLTRAFEVTRLELRPGLLNLSARPRSHDAVTLLFACRAANTLEGRLMISQQ